jgi:hypothetical protein
MTIYRYTKRYFCDGMCRNAVMQVLYQNEASWNDSLEPFLLASI